MDFSIELDNFIQEQDDVSDNFITGRNCILFLIDSRKEMYSAASGGNYVKRCLEFCRNIMLEIARKPANDLVGIVLYGTNKNEGKFAPDNVVLLQSLSATSALKIKKISELIEDDCSNLKQKYGTVDSANLAHALHFCQSVIQNNNTKVYTKNIVLFTCNDNPYANEPKIEHRIRKQAEEFQQLSIDFDVIGLGKFDSSKFYKEIVLTVRGELLKDWDGIDPIKNLDQLKNQLDKITDKFTSRLSFLHLGDNYKLNVSLYKLFSEPKKFATKNVYEKSLAANSDVIIQNSEEFDKELDNEFHPKEANTFNLGKVWPTVGGKQIRVTKNVLANLLHKKQRGFVILYFVSTEDIPLYFSISEPYLMLHHGNEKNNKEVFANLLIKCLEKGKSIICWCTLTAASHPCLVALQPTMNSTYAKNREHPPGFIVIRLPYSDMWLEVDVEENLAEPSQKQIEAAVGIVKKTTLPYSVDMFSDQERKKRVAMIEALALEYDDVEEVEDDTDVDLDDMAEKLKSLSMDFMDSSHIAEEEGCSKRKAVSKSSPSKKPASVLQLIKDGMAHKLTVAELRDFLRAEGVRSVSAMNKPMLVSVANQRFREGLKEE